MNDVTINEYINFLNLINKGFSKENYNLLKNYKNIKEIFDYNMFFELNEKVVNKIINILEEIKNKYIDIFIKYDIKILSIIDKKYPESLRNIPNPPLFLYYIGNISLINKKILGIVGTRKNTNIGKYYIYNFLKEAREYNIVTISGLAIGIDTLVHKYSIKNDIKTIAVLGSGLLNIYPKENIDLLKDIVKNEGLVITEYPPDFKPTKWSFPMRNRIISGLSQGLLVVESFKKGGSLITAEQSFENNKEVYTFPAFSYVESFQGNLYLIQKNIAKLIINFKDIVEDLQINRRKDV